MHGSVALQHLPCNCDGMGWQCFQIVYPTTKGQQVTTQTDTMTAFLST